MSDTCRITRLDGTSPVLDTTTGELVDSPSTIYEGKCRAKPVPTNRTGGERVGESVVAREATIISVPYAITGVQEGDRVELLTSADGQLLGEAFLIKAIQVGTHVTARRFICEALS